MSNQNQTNDSWLDTLLAEDYDTQVKIKIGSQIFTFRVITDMNEGIRLGHQAQEFIDLCKRPLEGAFKGLTPCEPAVAQLAFSISAASVEPKISQAGALRLAKERGEVFAQLGQVVQSGLSKIDVRLVEEVEERKNESSEISFGETS